jgi:hypothetical protein
MRNREVRDIERRLSMDEKTFLSAGEVAQLLRRSLKWVYSHANLRPGGFKLSGTWFWDKEILISELRALAKKPARTPLRSLRS